ncbi:putative FixW protein [Spironucleus salmonicida]|uniref:FixW protein n=1 Tax=Spironucleus salmonicida TaxID=348837 RepID=V6LH61_9EUKA|nr:putative FixW protein [Spironucleus salmonicida]|eukprot:EST43895.1 Thioredoxin-like domain-containing protein [Spironucleus salmonicida]
MLQQWKAFLFSFLAFVSIKAYLATKKQDTTNFLGTQVPNLSSLKYLTNTQFSLEDKYLMLEAFATWCPPCKQQIPHLSKLQKQFNRVQIISVSQEKEEVVSKFISSQPQMQEYTVAIDQDSTIQKFMTSQSVRGIPHCWIFNKGGHQIYSGHPSQVDSFITTLE